jgi:di/tricarboxylate transporter
VYFSAASFTLFVPTNNGSTIIGISNVPLPYLFVSSPSVHILSGILTLLALSSLLVAYQLHHKNNHDGFTRKLVAIAGTPFTLAGAASMSAGQLWANEAAAPSEETVGSLSDAREKHIEHEKTPTSTASKQEMMQRSAQYTYTLDWSGKVVRHS